MTQGTPEGWVPIVVRMPRELHDAVKAAAAREERSMAVTIRRALREYCARTWPYRENGDSFMALPREKR